jgi:hypothetical protein
VEQRVDGLTFRRTTRADLPRIVKMLAADAIGEPLLPAYLETFAAIDADPGQLLVVAEIYGAIVGTLHLTFLPVNTAERERPAMDHIGIDVHKRESQIYILAEGGEVIEQRIRTEACLLGAYRPAHRLSDPQRHVRGRLGVRDALVHTRTRDISVIRALLRQQGYRVPSGSAERVVDRVQALCPCRAACSRWSHRCSPSCAPSSSSSRTPTR